jgi:PAS domain-containing protein
VQAAPMAVVSADCEGRITSWNPAAEKIFGWTEKEALGTCGLTWTPDTATDRSLFRTIWHRTPARDRSPRVIPGSIASWECPSLKGPQWSVYWRWQPSATLYR